MVFQTEDLWQGVAGPTSLVELAAEQKPTNEELVEHHYSLCVLLHATLAFNLRAVKPLSLFDTKVMLEAKCLRSFLSRTFALECQRGRKKPVSQETCLKETSCQIRDLWQRFAS